MKFRKDYFFYVCLYFYHNKEFRKVYLDILYLFYFLRIYLAYLNIHFILIFGSCFTPPAYFRLNGLFSSKQPTKYSITRDTKKLCWGRVVCCQFGTILFEIGYKGQLESFILFPSLNNIQCQRHSCRRLEWKVRFIFS